MAKIRCVMCHFNDIGSCALGRNDHYLKKSSKNCSAFEDKRQKKFQELDKETNVGTIHTIHQQPSQADKPKVRMYEDKEVKYFFYVN